MIPVKYLIKDLKSKTLPLGVWLQGTLKSIVGNDIIIADSTGEVTVYGCNFTNVTVGDYCCVTGVAVNINNMPEINAGKIIKISSVHQQSWEMEVKEAHLVVQGIVAPEL